MSSNLFVRGAFVAAAAIGCAALLPACGGSSGGGAGSTRTGQVRVQIIWPAKTKAAPGRYIPPYASSILLELSPKALPSRIYSVIVNRPSNKPSTQDVTFPQLLSAGTYQLAGAARALLDAQGATVASGAVEIAVQPGMNPVALTLNSTVKTLLVLGQPLTATIGTPVTLQSGAFDPDGNGLLLPDGALTWSIVSGSQFGSITPGGKLTATSAGVIKVHLEEPVTKVFAEANVTASAQGSNTGLAQSGYPRAGADLGGTGLVTGSGALGTVAWHFDLGTRGVGTPVLGNNNTVFAMNQNGVVFGFNATTGAKLWQAAVPNLTGQILTASLVVSDDNTVFAATRAGVAAYDVATGLPKWSNSDFALSDEFTQSVNIAGGKLYVPTAGFGMAVIDARTGATLPVLPPGAGSDQTYGGAISAGRIYYLAGSRTQFTLYAVNLATGASVWTKDIGQGGYNGNSPIVSSSGTLYVALGDGNLTALNAATGAPVATMPVGGLSGRQAGIGQDGSVYTAQLDPAHSISGTSKHDSTLANLGWKSDVQLKQPTVGTDGTVYGTGFDTDQSGNTVVFALKGTDGTVKWKLPLLLGVPAAPPGWGQVPGATCVGPNGWVYVSSIDQQLYAIR